ncbi:unnamed protein product, partial [marine sediment metagenome]
FGSRYGKRVRAKLVKVESKQRIKQKCPFCGKLGAKRLSKGIWKCSKCDKKFAAGEKAKYTGRFSDAPDEIKELLDKAA